jgi:regulator of protease activity HflC (stomatin/prohibitin superfamily)
MLFSDYCRRLLGHSISGFRVAKEYERAVVFRLGRYTGLRGPGLFWLIPLGIETQTRIDLRVVTNPIEQQETITRDSVTVKSQRGAVVSSRGPGKGCHRR